LAEKHFTAPLLLTEYDGIGRINEPVTMGLPLPKGQIHSPAELALYTDSGTRLPLQGEVLAQWSDGSVQWLLLDFLATVGPKATVAYTVQPCAWPASEGLGPQIRVQDAPQALVVDTGVARFWLASRSFAPFQQVCVRGHRVLADTGSRIVLLGATGTVYQPRIRQRTVAATGPLRATVHLQGEFVDAQENALANFGARLSFYAGSSLVTMQFTVHNPRAAAHVGGLWDLGDAGSVYFRDLAITLPLRSQQSVTQAWTLHPHHPLVASPGTGLEIYQDSSGGQHWRSRNHANRHGLVMHTMQGYRVTVDGCGVQTGLRAVPVVAIGDAEKRIVAAIDQFWQNFPKALEVAQNMLSLRLFPQQYGDVYELQGGEQKTHTVFLQFDSQPEDWPEVRWWHLRLLPRSTPEWYASTQAIPYLVPRWAEKHTDYQALVETAITGDHTFFARREIIDEYGWRHFGDLYADHEAVGQHTEAPLVSHYNNQYDAIYGAMVHYLRSGDCRWFQLGAELARHVMDIDIYHTCADRPVYNHGLFWHTDHYVEAATATHRTYSQATKAGKGLQHYGGGPSNEHNYTTGLLHYYFLTGDPAAREAVCGLANWVMQMDDGSRRRFGWLDHRPTGLASATVSPDYHGPGRGPGNSINALLDAAVLSREPHYLAKAEALIRRCIHPKDNIQARHLEDVEHRWSYTVFLQVLGKYLDIKAEAGQMDGMYGYARASLLHYAAWMSAHEVPSKQVLHKVEIPTETWPAQDIRKSVVFNFAARHAPEPLRDIYLQRATEFFRACITDVLSFETCRLTRPIVLLMTNGYMQAYFERHPEAATPPCAEYEFGHPQRFRPQFYELYKVRQALRRLGLALQAARERLQRTMHNRRGGARR
jgi:hypothetical protein